MKNYNKTFPAGLKLLLEMGYEQKKIVLKMNALGVKLKASTLTGLKKSVYQNDRISRDRLSKYGPSIEQIIEQELGLRYNEELDTFEEIEGAVKSVIEIATEKEKIEIAASMPFTFHGKGRLDTREKTDFFADAEHEVIEFGVKLEQFVNYFEGRGDWEFREPVLRILEKGVNFKCYLLEPDSNIARMYFEDRAKANELELEALKKLPEMLKKLKRIASSLNAYGHRGKFMLFTYKNIPSCSYFAVDKDYFKAKMIVSQYIYGIRRAKSPSLEISKKK